MKQQVVLIFLPGETPQLSIWRPGHSNAYHTRLLDSKLKGPVLLDELTHFLTSQNLKLADLTHIGVMTGPASYTHLRIFVATSNTIAWSLALPLFGFDNSAQLPTDLPILLTAARINRPVEPVYPLPRDGAL